MQARGAVPCGAPPLVAVILPPREGFGPGRTGALGMIAHRLLATPGFRTAVFGGPQSGPVFDNAPFHAVRPAIWWPGNVNLRFAASLTRTLRRMRPALIEVHNRPEIALALAARFPDTPVTVLLNNDPQAMREARRPGERAALLRRLDRVMVASDWLSGRLLDGVPPPSRPPFVLHNCIDLAALPPPAAREKLILFAGRLVPEKGADTFVAACAAALPALPGWRAEMIGADRFRADSPDTDFIRSLRDAARADGVALLGYRDHPEVLEAMARAAIVVVPSRWQEPFGLTAVEALACGASLICSRRGGLPEIGGEVAVYADPDDPLALGEAIRSLALDDARRQALEQAGPLRARQFDVTVAATRLAALRREVLADRAARIERLAPASI
ncbi:MAG: glycosyltransferase family 4 protein [Alphaproteobacteria bacterium]|nr:glycosyltransferase family 4 protein [Alphaproteobacteria bacterium]